MQQKNSNGFSGISNFFSFFHDNLEWDYNSKAMSKYIDERNAYRDMLHAATQPKSYLNQFFYISNLYPLHTDTSILQDFLGRSLKSLILKLGNPAYTFINGDITVIVYKWKFNKVKDKCEVHFYKSKAFLVVHNYQSSAASDQSRVEELIADKYFGKTQPAAGFLNSQIIDKDHNRIFVDATAGLKVIYLLNHNSEWFIDMTAEVTYQKALADRRSEHLELQLAGLL